MKGSFRKRGDKWSFAVDLGKDPITGKRRQKTRSGFKTKKEAQAACAELISEVEKGVYFETKNITVKEVWERAQEIRKQELKPLSIQNSEYTVKNHILPKFGDMNINKVNTLMVQKHYQELYEDGLSASTVQYIHVYFQIIFNFALDWEIVKNTPLKKVKLPKTEKKIPVTWSIEQCNTFLDFLEKREYYKERLFFLLAIFTGMRRGEISALQWKDIDSWKKQISVTKTTISQIGKGLVITSPKTPSSIRNIAISDYVLEQLTEYKTHQKKEYLQYGLKVTDGSNIFDGTEPLKLYNPASAAHFLQRFSKRLHLPHVKLHGLRHTHATIMLENGENPKIVQERLGHKNVQTTLNVYSHLTPTIQQQSASRFEESFSKKIINEM
ncbi:site-specific integrase [Gottfriedia acidiceleris]|uniref:site-specific integrase n=1 Tax=Gottfriedia acidiceleris TaxID=371036 RepID=UPI00101D9D9D|nr:site-specific integrase [Gottfriedia acidiceleris]